MNNREKYLLLKTVQEDNILPVTSACNMNCKFCSHHQNPAAVEVYRFGHLDYDLVLELISYLPSDGPVVVGESASKIVEGEPFLHPEFKKIMTQLRRKYPAKKIKLTTNGSFLSKTMVGFLEGLQPLELNISLNCAGPEQRVFLMGDLYPETVFAGFSYLQDTSIDYNGSIVAVPHLLGWEYLKETVAFLRIYNCSTIRIFLPGFTDYTPAELKFNPDLFYQLKKFTEEVNNKSKIPVILEPPFLSDLQCKIKGVIPRTPAAEAGIKINDIIEKINDYQPRTRVDAFNKVVERESPELTMIRNEKSFQIQLKKETEQKPGFIVDYDLSPSTYSSLEEIIYYSNVSSIFVVTSELAANLMHKIMEKIKNKMEKTPQLKVIPVTNNFFGGTIMCAGLLVNSDIIAALEEENTGKSDLILLPRIIYDSSGKDLTGKSYHEIEHHFGVKVITVE